MTINEFSFWLNGYLADKIGLTADQFDVVKKQFASVSIDTDAKTKEVLEAILNPHGSTGQDPWKFLPTGLSSVLKAHGAHVG